MIVIVFGLPGSGKSFFAARLAEMFNAEYINSDKIRKELFAHRTYSDQEKSVVYNVMLEKMKEAVQKQQSLVLDATFHKKETRDLFQKEVGVNGKIQFIEVWSEENTIRERLKLSRPYSEADYNVYRIIRQQWEPMNKPHLRLESTNDNITFMLKKAAAHLQIKDDKGTDQ